LGFKSIEKDTFARAALIGRKICFMKKRDFIFCFICLLPSWIWAGTITVSPASIPNFGNCPVYFASDPQRYTVNASALSQALSIVAPSHFEISLSYNSEYAQTISLQPIAGNINSIVIFVRFSPFQTGSKSGNIVHSSAGSTTQNKAVIGTALLNTATGTNASTYYSTIGNSTGASLKTDLYNKILGHTVTGYSGLWATYTNADPFFNGKVWDIYSTRLNANSPFEFTFGTDQCGNYSVEGDCYNREHSFPQSWFSSSAPMVSDMVHIYPTDGKVNGMRSNYPFGEVSSPTYTSMQGAKLGANTTPGYSGIVFEPINDYKGDLARSYFYMATRYQNLIAGWQSNGNADEVLAGNSFPAYDAWFIELLLKWHNQDPPSVKEINRNNVLYGYQNNRNPFVDSPQYAHRIWGIRQATEPTLAATQFNRLSFNSNSINIAWRSGNGQKRIVIARVGSPVNAFPVDSQTYAANTVFGSGAQIGSGNFVVYNGMGSNIEVSGLNPSLNYHFLVIEYNGTGPATNYQTTSVLHSGSVSLPVTWLSFSAHWATPETVLLNWQTANETNNDYFEIQRQIEGSKFTSIGQIKGKGNSVNVSDYSYMDFLPERIKTLAYRIKQVDRNGEYSYSKTVSLLGTGEVNNIIQAVNPIKGSIIQLKYEGEPEEVEIFVNYLNGSSVMYTKTILKDETFIPLENTFGAGMYILRIVQRARTQTFKIIIQP
jgi:endonuclease I